MNWPLAIVLLALAGWNLWLTTKLAVIAHGVVHLIHELKDLKRNRPEDRTDAILESIRKAKVKGRL